MDSLACEEVCLIAGRVLYVEGPEVWCAAGQKLLKSNDGGKSWAMRATLPTKSLREQLTISRLGRRLGRSGYHHFLKTGTNSGLAIAHQHVFQVRPGDVCLHRIAQLQGSRPLTLCVAGKKIYYGEYRGNPERSPVHIWAAGHEGHNWQPVWQFDGIRHVHGVFHDTYTSAIWVATGDKDNEAAIWITHDQFRHLERVVGGTQQYRAVQLLFTEKHVYFGSDAPDQINYIYRLERGTGRIEPLVKVGEPVFFGCKVNNSLFFSTAVEPSNLKRSIYAKVWGSNDGENWKLIRSFRKDGWPIKYFQYGQVLFPMGPGDNKNLWYTPMATEQDQISHKLPLPSLQPERQLT